MRSFVRAFAAASVVGMALFLSPPKTALPAGFDEVKAFYFGNSLTGNTMPGLHPLLAKSVGKRWTVDAAITPGVPIWVHMKRLMDKGPDAERFRRVGAQTDAIVMLIFGGDGLASVVTEKWQGKVKFDQPTDIGDVAACSYLIREYLQLNPKGRAYIYTAWPGIPAVKEFQARIREEAIQSAIRSGEKRQEAVKRIELREPSHEEMEPLRKSFDYAAHWLKEYDPAKPQGNTHTRGHMYAVMEGLKKNFPELWREGRLGMIPVGDIFLELDKKMRAGQIPGLTNIGQFYTDGGHLRSGLPRYTLAAAYYAVLFRDNPGGLDWRIFQDRGNYESEKYGFYVHQPDLGVHIDITAARAKAVNETIWEVVRRHPYTQFLQNPKPKDRRNDSLNKWHEVER
ncbi:MAG: hypothetical protein N3D11_12770 [Candidatus Sumerlaeia bacterium]|nr:hypothetical protein [Candidatus Sumerlaeia bacterium]